MKKVTLFSLLSFSILFANPAVMGGITYNFGSSSDALANLGASLKILSTAEENKPVVGAGVSFYPLAKGDKQFGLDISAGYNFKKGAIMGGWDFLKEQPSLSLGYNKEISTEDSNVADTIQDARCKNAKK